MAFRSGQRLGKYTIQKRLAEGGFASVYAARDTVEGVRVALKIPHAHLVSATMLEGFRQEVRLAASLDHPNILPIKNAQFIERHFTISYPLGEASLEERMQRRIALERRVELALQMLEAVAFAHTRRVIHLDLKPDNLILFPGGRLRLTDFGISKLARRTVIGSGSGTVGYVAPEQAMGRASPRSDVFSLGLILWQLFSGSLPEWPYRQPLPGLAKLRARVRPGFIGLLHKALQVDQAARFADANEMLRAFRRLHRAGAILRPRKRRGPAGAPAGRARRNGTGRDWRALRVSQFRRAHGTQLQTRHACARCEGPVSEAMLACPWCGDARPRHRGGTRRPATCPRCRRGRKLDWRWCPWCYGPRFRSVSTRAFGDAAYTARCTAPGCDRRELAPFMRYCPWCHAKVRRAWRIAGAARHHPCEGCGWGVLPEYWRWCPWCGKEQSLRS